MNTTTISPGNTTDSHRARSATIAMTIAVSGALLVSGCATRDLHPDRSEGLPVSHQRPADHPAYDGPIGDTSEPILSPAQREAARQSEAQQAPAGPGQTVAGQTPVGQIPTGQTPASQAPAGQTTPQPRQIPHDQRLTEGQQQRVQEAARRFQESQHGSTPQPTGGQPSVPSQLPSAQESPLTEEQQRRLRDLRLQ